MLELLCRDLWCCHGHDSGVHFFVRAWYILRRGGKYLRELWLGVLSSFNGTGSMLQLPRGAIWNHHGHNSDVHFFVRGRHILGRWGKFLCELWLGVLSSCHWADCVLKLRLRDLWYGHGHDCGLHFFVRAWYILGRWGKFLRQL